MTAAAFPPAEVGGFSRSPSPRASDFSCYIMLHIPILSLHGLSHSCTSQGI
ncbi:hypothetical protein HMPREF3039_00910 [Akkermansia sp. KLE1798]|nr:hypothetical protein HMPREF3039_00910 [Akkermansia sp. KLE1798]